MKSIVSWAIDNSPAMNTLMLAVLMLGVASLVSINREVFPSFELETILIRVPYPGATPSEVEEGICQKLEEAVRSVSGIKRQMTIAQEGMGLMAVEVESHIGDVQKILNQVRAEIDRIPSFPELAEDPEIEQMTWRIPAIRIGVVGPDQHHAESNWRLRAIAESIRNDLLQLPSVSQANLLNVPDFQIDVEVPEEALRRHGLSLREVAQIIRRENIELPGGKMTTSTQDVLLRGKNKRLTGEEIAKIPLVTASNGVVLTVGDLAEVRDEFDDTAAAHWIDGHPAIVISLDRTASEDLLKITDEVKQYVARQNAALPSGYRLVVWLDTSIDVRDRLQLLLTNGLQGLILVFLVLAIFLELKLAFWVAVGIPVAVLGGATVLYAADQTLNMLSLFAFLLVLGIIVDDAIVIGENIYTHREREPNFVTAAVNGTCEVLPAVATSVTTTIFAFLPLFFVSGVLGKFIAVLPLAVVAMLAISLVESCLMLPCHLAHRDSLFFKGLGLILFPLRPITSLFASANRGTHRLFDQILPRLYLPALKWSLAHPAIVISGNVALLIFTVGFIRSGLTPWVLFPQLDSRSIEVKFALPDGTPSGQTARVTRELEAALECVNQRYDAPVVKLVHRSIGETTRWGAFGPETPSTGGHFGRVHAELVEPSRRTVTSDEILRGWRDEVRGLPEAERASFASAGVGPVGAPIEFKLLAPAEHADQLEEAARRSKKQLANDPGVLDIRTDLSPGKWEYQLRINDRALAMGITAADLAETVRASYYGEEVMRLQRGRHEVKLMVRYPREQRRSLAEFREIRVRGRDDIERPLTELAEVTVQRAHSEINRTDQLRSITITADVDETQTNAHQIVRDLQASFLPGLLEDFPAIRVRWEGQEEQYAESMQSLATGFLLALFAMYCLFTLQFRSYFQPVIILLIIPFGFIGAVWGHVLLGYPITIFSVFGMVALTGVVVNDSIVLVDFINQRTRNGVPLDTALIEAGSRRFRPVLLTSLTTIAGLLPILLETSFQAQMLIPMAISLAFGLLASTALVLLVVPTSYFVYVTLFRVWLPTDDEVDEASSTPAEPVEPPTSQAAS